jgi:uncharacterized membrane protein YhhN
MRAHIRIGAWQLWAAATIAFLLLMMAGNQWGLDGISPWAKAAASTCFIATAIARGAWASRFGQGILAGLVLSWFGDVFLAQSGDAFFLAGLASFLLGHVAYCAAFGIHGVNLRWSAIAAVALTPLVFVILRWLLPHVEAPMKAPVIAYIVVITAMVLLAWGTRGKGGHIAIVIGAMLFFFSDIAVARARFVAPGEMDWLWGLPLYYVGQLFLAYSAGARPKQIKRE